MSDAVVISLISALASTVAAVISLVNNFIGRRNTTHIEETKQAVVTLEKSTNGMQDKLIKATGEAEFAKGVLHGKSEGPPS